MKKPNKKQQAFSNLCQAIIEKSKPKGSKGKIQIKRDKKNQLNELRRKAYD